MLIKEIRDPEIYLALKKVCQFLVNEAWHTSGDIDLDYAIAKTKEYEDDVRQLSELNTDADWAEMYPGNWASHHKGDFSPWYTGELTLEALLESLEILAENIASTTPRFMPEMEFLHYYDFLRSKIPKSAQVVKAAPAMITISNLHPKIQEHCRRRFNSGLYSDAILTAYKVVLNEIKDITGIRDVDGKQLVERAFSLSNPLIKLNPLTTQSDKDEQLGFMLLYSGATVGIRNPKAHDLVVQEDKQKALLYLSFASLLMQRLDEREE